MVGQVQPEPGQFIHKYCLSQAEDWTQIDKAEKNAAEFARRLVTDTLDFSGNALRQQFQAEWKGYDAFCREEFGLDAETLLNGGNAPAVFLEWLQEALQPLSEAALAEQKAQEQAERLKALLVEGLSGRCYSQKDE